MCEGRIGDATWMDGEGEKGEMVLQGWGEGKRGWENGKRVIKKGEKLEIIFIFDRKQGKGRYKRGESRGRRTWETGK